MPGKRGHCAVLAALILAVAATMARAQEPSSNPLPVGSRVFPAVVSEEVVSEPMVAQPVTTSPLGISVPNLLPGFQFYAGLLLLKPSSADLGYGVLTTEKNFASPDPIATPYWNIESVSPTFQAGFELGTGYVFANSGQDFQVNWQHLRTSNSTSAGITQSDGQWISPFSQTGPPTAATLEDMYLFSGVNLLHGARAQANFAYDMVNFDFGQYVNVGSSLMLRFFGGLSYAKVQEQILSTFYGVTPDPNGPFPDNVPRTLSFNNTSRFSGAGPRIGFDTRYLTRCGLRFTSQLAGALLAGRTQPSQYIFNATGPDLAAVGIPVNHEGVYSSPVTHVVYATNAKLGVGFSRVFSNGSILTIDGGFMAALFVQPFYGYLSNNNVIGLQTGSLSTASMRQTTSDFTLHGVYLNGGLTW